MLPLAHAVHARNPSHAPPLRSTPPQPSAQLACRAPLPAASPGSIRAYAPPPPVATWPLRVSLYSPTTTHVPLPLSRAAPPPPLPSPSPAPCTAPCQAMHCEARAAHQPSRLAACRRPHTLPLSPHCLAARPNRPPAPFSLPLSTLLELRHPKPQHAALPPPHPSFLPILGGAPPGPWSRGKGGSQPPGQRCRRSTPTSPFFLLPRSPPPPPPPTPTHTHTQPPCSAAVAAPLAAAQRHARRTLGNSQEGMKEGAEGGSWREQDGKL